MSQPHPCADDALSCPACLIGHPEDHGSLAADLRALLGSWAWESGAVLAGDRPAQVWEDLQHGVDRAVDECLATLLQRARDRGELVPLRPTWIAVRTVRGLVVSRLLGRPLDPAQVPDLVVRVLLPLLHRGLQPV